MPDGRRAPGQALPTEVARLNSALRRILPNASVAARSIDLPGPLKLWLINPEGWERPLSEQETGAAFDAPPCRPGNPAY